MAAITSANVTLITQYDILDRGRLVETVRVLDIVLAAQGGTTGDIPASALGYSAINWVESLRSTDGSSVIRKILALLTDSTQIQPVDLTQVTDANRDLAANITGTWRVRVAGRRDPAQ